VPGTSPLDRVRALCLSFPETSERLSHGQPSFFIGGKKTFVMYLDDHHGDGRLALWLAAPEGMQQALVEAAPEHYFRPPYVGHHEVLGAGRCEEAECLSAQPLARGLLVSRHQRADRRFPGVRALALLPGQLADRAAELLRLGQPDQEMTSRWLVHVGSAPGGNVGARHPPRSGLPASIPQMCDLRLPHSNAWPLPSALATSCARDRAPTLAIALRTWVRTVACEMCS